MVQMRQIVNIKIYARKTPPSKLISPSPNKIWFTGQFGKQPQSQEAVFACYIHGKAAIAA